MGKLLEFALSYVGDDRGTDSANDRLFAGIACSLKAGTPLSDYEYHVFVEVILLHVRLQALHASNTARN
jgi:hypothetical protein